LFYSYLIEHMGISERAAELVCREETELTAPFARADEISAINQLKVLHAMQTHRLSETHFSSTTGYGYNDAGREVTEEIFAAVFKGEAALVRPQLISGTHALACALFGNLRPGDELLSPVGKPYDTLEKVIGIRPGTGSLAEYGIRYTQIDLTPKNGFDFESISQALQSRPKMITIQRSKGYAWRPTFTVRQIKELIDFIREHSPQSIILVDNCYGEFVEETEPLDAGADIIAGSLIKNPGGGLAPGGGYVIGKTACVEAAAVRLTSPGLGRDAGPMFGLTRTLLQGLFVAPQAVSGSVKAAVLAAAVFRKLGFDVCPGPDEPRSDIVQAIRLNSQPRVLAFCRGIQQAAAVDAFVTPVPAPMPGYDAEVVMAAGAFIQGSSIELSADAPVTPPYIVYLQGGLTEAHAKAGVVFALDALMREGLCP
jgi:cystathionine beta-lyase family protein involved in aluminum resistance